MDPVDEQLIDRIVSRAREDGLLQALTKRLMEPRSRARSPITWAAADTTWPGVTVGTPVMATGSRSFSPTCAWPRFDVPRDRDATIEPKIVINRRAGCQGVDELVISLSTKA